MNPSVLNLINELKATVAKQEAEIKKLKKEKQHLSTVIFDNRYTIRQLKAALHKINKTQAEFKKAA
jgi:septal ring factor EnvC (AmiA/AmiB activator)